MFFNNKQNFYTSNLESYIENLQKGHLECIPWIFCTFAENSTRHKLKAAQALNKTLSSLSFDDIFNVDMRMRETTSMEWSIDWRTLSIKNFITKQMSENERRAVLVFASFNPNGYIREQAVQLLTYYDQTLPFIILRCNDWVYNVRQTALIAFSEKIKIASDEDIIDALPFMEKLRKSERCQYDTFLSIMYSKIESNKPLVEKALISKNIRTRRFCIFFLLNSAIVNHTLLLAHIKREKDPFLRRMIFQSLQNTNIDIEILGEQLLKDKYPRNRVLALHSLFNNKSSIAFDIAETMLLDKNTQVRTLARDIISQKENVIDFHQFYLDKLLVNTPASLYGLGETGSRDDCQLIVRFLANDRISVIRAAMTSLMRLDSETFLPHIIEMLLSEHVGIVKTAMLLIKKCGNYNFKKIFEIHENTTYENTKIKCASLLFCASKWKALTYILMLIGGDFEKLDNLCQRQINKWILSYNRSYVVASEDEKHIINKLITDKQKILKPQIEKQLLFLLK